MQVAGEIRVLVKVDDSVMHPPDVPNIPQTIATIEHEVIRKMGDPREGKNSKEDKINQGR